MTEPALPLLRQLPRIGRLHGGRHLHLGRDDLAEGLEREDGAELVEGGEVAEVRRGLLELLGVLAGG